MQFLQGNAVALRRDGEKLTGLGVQTADGQMRTIPVDHVFAFFGLHPKLGPIAEWGLEMERRALKVDTEKFRPAFPESSPSATSIPIPARKTHFERLS